MQQFCENKSRDMSYSLAGCLLQPSQKLSYAYAGPILENMNYSKNNVNVL